MRQIICGQVDGKAALIGRQDSGPIGARLFAVASHGLVRICEALAAMIGAHQFSKGACVDCVAYARKVTGLIVPP